MTRCGLTRHARSDREAVDLPGKALDMKPYAGRRVLPIVVHLFYGL